MMFSRKNSLFSNNSVFQENEDKLIEEAITTPYEKVLKILNNIKSHLIGMKTDPVMVRDLDWVVMKIQSNKLYTYDHSDQSEEFSKLSKNSHEVKSFFEFLQNYSENKELKRREMKKVWKTTLVRERNFPKKKISVILKNKGGSGTENSNCEITNGDGTPKNDLVGSLNKTNKSNFIAGMTHIRNLSQMEKKVGGLKFDENDENDENESQNLDISPINIMRQDRALNKNDQINFTNLHELLKKEEEEKSEIHIVNIEQIENPDLVVVKDGDFNPVERDFSVESSKKLSTIYEMDFNIFEFSELVGFKSFVIGGKLLIEHLDFGDLIKMDNLENFLTSVRDGYRDNPYHNQIHGLDVCQTMCMYLTKTNLTDLLFLNDIDVLSIFISSLTHDMGHPGYSNIFQINTLSELALIYNDKSVLENFHISETYKVLRSPGCNILEKIDNQDFKHIRRRIVESILATDMNNHAKIHSVFKNKLISHNVKNGENQGKVISKDSNSLFDEQQDVINFLLHAADISHNSKNFNISYKWTYLLMNEFWKQGDTEKSLNLPVSFLCDRNSVNVPKSQIGFITGIIIPTFDALVDFLPGLGYYLENVLSNIEEWRKIILEEEKIIEEQAD